MQRMLLRNAASRGAERMIQPSSKCRQCCRRCWRYRQSPPAEIGASQKRLKIKVQTFGVLRFLYARLKIIGLSVCRSITSDFRRMTWTPFEVSTHFISRRRPHWMHAMPSILRFATSVLLSHLSLGCHGFHLTLRRTAGKISQIVYQQLSIYELRL